MRLGSQFQSDQERVPTCKYCHCHLSEYVENMEEEPHMNVLLVPLVWNMAKPPEL